jgi:hypothetical protein
MTVLTQHWKIAGLLPLEDATDIHARLPGVAESGKPVPISV